MCGFDCLLILKLRNFNIKKHSVQRILREQHKKILTINNLANELPQIHRF